MKRGVVLIAIASGLGLLLAGFFLADSSPDVMRAQAARSEAPQQYLSFWTEDFSTAPVTGTYYITATTGSGVVDGGSFKLTQDLSGERGRIFYLKPTLMTKFKANFRFNVGTKDWQGADGVAFNFCPAYDYPPDDGGSLDASCPNGYMVAFDTFENYDYYPDEVYVASGTYANRLTIATLTTNLEDGNWHDAEVTFDQGAITVTLDTSIIIAGYNIPGYMPFTGYFGLSSGTGMYSNEQRVDDIQIQIPLFWDEDFSVDPPPGTYITATAGSGLVDNGTFLFTQNSQTQRGRIFYTTPTLMTNFYATFRLYLGATDGADGAAFIFCPTYDYLPNVGGTLDANCPGGYLVAFDTYETVYDLIYVAYGTYANRLRLVNSPIELEDNDWHDVAITLEQGAITVNLDGSDVISGFDLPGYTAFAGYFGFGGATGAATNEQRLDDIQILAEDPDYGILKGHVYEAATMTPLESISIIAEDGSTDSWQTKTDLNGFYSIAAVQGFYTVTAMHPAYITQWSTGVEVTDGSDNTVNFNLSRKVNVEPAVLEAWVFTGTQVYEFPTGLDITNHLGEDLEFQIYETSGLPGVARATQPAANGTVEISVEDNAEKGATQDESGDGILPSASGGPDPFGYTYIDSNEPGGPVFDWIEIAPPAGGDGSPAGLAGGDDVRVWPIDLPFPFNFYGTYYDQIAISCNGGVYFSNGILSFTNNTIPNNNSSGVNTLIASYWDDLVISGEVYYKHLDDRFVIEFYNARAFNTGGDYGTWEIILYVNGNILLQYLDTTIGSGNYGASATVGIQGDPVMGLQYSYNTASLSDGLAIQFSYPQIPWIWELPATGTVPAQSTYNVDISVSTVVSDPLPLGTYNATLWVMNDKAPALQVPVTMHIVDAFIIPIPGFNYNAPVFADQATDFTNTSTTGTPTTQYYIWNFGDGTTITTPNADPVSHIYNQAGTYTVTLTAHQAQTGINVVYTHNLTVMARIFVPVVLRD